MHRTSKRAVEKIEALDFTAGKIHARKLPRARWHQQDLLEYLSVTDALEREDEWE